MEPWYDWSSKATRFCSGLSAWNREPELYAKTFAMSPVANRVLTMLSPSPPCGRVSTFTLMPEFLALKAFARASEFFTVDGSLSTRNDTVVPSSLDPRSPALHAPRARRAAAATARAARLDMSYLRWGLQVVVFGSSRVGSSAAGR